MRALLRLTLGLLVSWLSMSIAFADVVPPKVDTTTPTGMSIPDTEFRVDSPDLAIGSLSLERFNQSPSIYWPDYSQFGMLMTSNFDIYVSTVIIKASGPPYYTVAHRHAIVHIGNSAVGTYSIQNISGSGAINPHNSDAGNGILGWSGTSYQFTDKAGNIYTFTPSVSAHPTVSGINYGAPAPASQRIDHINFANGRTWQFTYDANQRVKLVEDTSGYAILFDYGANGFVSAACGIDRSRSYVTSASTCAGQSLAVSYQYASGTSAYGGSVPLLAGFTDALGKTTSYAHFPTVPSISCVIRPGQSACQMQLSGAGGGVQTLADGNVWTLVGSQGKYTVNDPEVPQDSSYGATVTDPANKTTNYVFAGSSPLSVTDANGKTTTFRWCCSQLSDAGTVPTFDGTMLLEADFPEGNKYLALHGGPFGTVSRETMQAKPGSGLSDQVVNYSYDATFSSGVLIAQPTAKTDPNGNTTNWTYTGFGAVASEMRPAPSSGAMRPLKLYSYVQKYAYIQNSSGTLVAAATPIWLPASETDCETAAGGTTPVCGSGSLQMVTTYQYGADGTVDNLLLRGKVVTANGVSLRTCYGYDDQSNKIWETSPRAGLATCS